MTINRQIIMKTRPEGMPKHENFEIIENKIPDIRHGEVLIKILWLSLDPYMRGRMSKAKSYAASLNEGDLIVGGAVGRVINSETSQYKEGDIVEGFTLGWQEYAIATPATIRKINPELAPIQTAVGVLGMPGMTAFFGLLHVGKPIPGDTVVVSAASGAVGQLVGQIAKIAGCHVVGIAGGQEKCDFLTNSLNFDAAIDYKNENVDDMLDKYCPNGVNVYFDNVGGSITDSVINKLANYARVAVCGVISQYNLIEEYSIKKIYPEQINVEIKPTKIIAKIAGNNNFLVGSNGKLISNEYNDEKLPFLFGKFNSESFILFKNIVNKSEFNFKNFSSINYYSSNRWDIQTNNGILIKLPEENLIKALKAAHKIINNDKFKDVKIIDLRISNQIIMQ